MERRRDLRPGERAGVPRGLGDPLGGPAAGPPGEGPLVPSHAAEALPLDPDEEQQTVFAVFSGAVRKGRWEPPAELRTVAVCGGVELDFREADLLEGETVVDCLAIMGGVDITVPPDIHVKVSGFGLLGGFTHVDQTAADPGAPLLHVKGFACMGGVGIRVKEPKRPRRRAGKG